MGTFPLQSAQWFLLVVNPVHSTLHSMGDYLLMRQLKHYTICCGEILIQANTSFDSKKQLGMLIKMPTQVLRWCLSAHTGIKMVPICPHRY